MHPFALLLWLLAAPALASDYLGSERCADCHEAEYAAWRGSHHDLAMQRPTPATVLGDFDDARFSYNGVETRFFRREDAFIVRTDGPDGQLTDYEVAYVFGVDPLQQYLLPLSDGRLQALSIAWDSRPASEGGQRWYHLYPDEAVAHNDPLHWTGPYQNWNARCAECHSTDVHKNYSAATGRYDTTYEEIDVACEACHGPGARHVALAEGDHLAGVAAGGFPVDLGQRGVWAFPEGAAIARRGAPLTDNRQIDNCGRCHARRGTLGDYHYGADLLDTHRLSFLQPPLYHPDGQILDEVYVYGSFVQSKMHLAGVVCSNCHEPHSNALRAPGNGVCAQCHKPEVYDSTAHHHREPGPGSVCVDCHMPATTYMGVDARRDHSMRIPRPDLSLMLGTPNACNGCHDDRDAAWALAALRDRGVTPGDTASHPARTLHRLRQGDRRAADAVRAQVSNPSLAPLWRATALETFGNSGDRRLAETAAPLLAGEDPLLRLAAVRSIAALPLGQRYGMLRPLINDPVAGVRLEVAASLAGVPPDRLRGDERAALEDLFEAYLAIQTEHADMPSVQLQLGVFHSARGALPAAEGAYREALRLNPLLVPAHLNLADLLRVTSREGEARAQLERARAIAPDSGDVLHALGLLAIRAGDSEQALALLAGAAERETGTTRHRYVHAVALHDLGDPHAAVRALRQLNREAPGNPDILLALVNYSAEVGMLRAALEYAETLVTIAPENEAWRRLRDQLAGAVR
ncbi:tetratricopeptide repeat protein [Pseudohaliea rubra]|uniref:Putative deca-heme c-type cytochrome n=1 Tax=Pseudohaliea rubra DSM 19751 TaxID=1265313 RepID=A0A095VRJ8_9GAMM|nr:tetratricopeptide repeat protein [Pseudohaliea rubra]KGE03703.1 putative deca-heme c-type cytochrome [Pseudohaliea rubra DSM 19751]